MAFGGSRGWFKIEDDGTDFIFSWSNDGEFWVEFLSVANDDFLTTYDGVGIFVNVQYSGTPHRFGLRLLSWELT